MSRGLKNNNPGNIRLSKVHYLGETQSSDKAFKQFESIDWGYRAMFVVIDSYYRRGLKTLSEIINRYAPPVENHTDGYINFVSKRTGITPEKMININDKQEFSAIVSAMSYMENGTPALEKDVEQGWLLYLKFRP